MDWLQESHNMVDVIHGVIVYDGLEAKVIESTTFSRLQRIMQSSLAYMTYPSNKVHRFEHSVGVMHLAGQFFFNSINNSDKKDVCKLLDEVDSEIKRWLSGSESDKYLKGSVIADAQNDYDGFFKPKDKKNMAYLDNKLYRGCTPSNLDNNQLVLYYAVYEAIRLTGLLHDIGHLPYSHITEFALKHMYNEVEYKIKDGSLTKEIPKVKEFIDTIKPYCDKDNQIHEQVGQKLVKKIFGALSEEFSPSFPKEDTFLAAVFYLTEQILNSKPSENTIFSDLHRAVDGVIDCDRMDYCCRDLYCSGVSRELPKYERIFDTVKLFYNTLFVDDNSEADAIKRLKCNFAFNSKALGQIEMLLQRRWEDFTTINFHHAVHKHELLLKLAIAELGKECLLDQGDDGVENVTLPLEVSSIWKVIKAAEGKGSIEILCSQLDDEWLNTLLKHKFYKKYGNSYASRMENHNDIQWNVLDELITGQKHYCSLFKRNGGFGRFDDAFREKCIENGIVSVDFSFPGRKDNECVFAYLLRTLLNKEAGVRSELYYAKVKDELNAFMRSSEAQKLGIVDCLIDENEFSVGIKPKDMESIFIISSQQGKAASVLRGRSSIFKILDMQKNLFPHFHIYYLPEFDVEHNEYKKVDKDKIQASIADVMAKTMKKLMV